MYNYIYEQVNLIEKYTPVPEKDLKLIEDKQFNKLIITSTGSSLKASLISRELLKIKSSKIQVCSPAELQKNKKNLLDKKSLLIVVSQTGESVSVLDCLQYAKQEGIYTLSLTSGHNNSIALNSDKNFDIQCGIERIGPKTKGVTMTILTLTDLVYKLNTSLKWEIGMKPLLKPSTTFSRVKEIDGEIVLFLKRNCNWGDCKAISIFGFGLDDYICREGSLKILETLLVPVMNYPGEEFMHGPHRLINQKQKFIVLDTEDNSNLNLLLKYAREKNAQLLVISNKKESDVHVYSWFESLIAFQLLAYYLPINVGINPDEPVNADFAKKVGSRT